MKEITRFPGFKRSYREGFFKYPNELEVYWKQLSGSESKLLTLVLRKTYGFQKLTDYISISQFVKATGVSKAQVQRSLKGLEEKGFISTESNGYRTRLIKLVLRDDEAEEPVKENVAASDQTAYLISLFRDISPHLVDGYITSKAQIQAMERLLQHYSQSDIEGFIAGVRESFGRQFAPTITSPADLEKKLPQLVSYFKRKEDKEQNGFKITF